jgi:diguanylate cyclase (GGDEF)-like protein
MGTRSGNGDSAGRCLDDGAVAQVCQPRVRTRLLLVGDSEQGRRLAQATAERLRTGLVHRPRPRDAGDDLDNTRVSCVLLDAATPGLDALTALGDLDAARPEVPIVVLGADSDPALGLAAVKAGAQDYVVREEADAGSLERSVRYAIDRKRAEVQLAHIARHDQLTGLANRSLLEERLTRALAGGEGVAMLFIDLDGFKRINDNLGHAAGDAALREAGSRIRAAVRPADTVARLGGDEFAVLCQDVRDEVTALTIAHRVTGHVEQPLQIDGQEIVLRASVGVALGDDTNASAGALLLCSDDAMYAAKSRGGGCPQVYTPVHGRERHNGLELEAALRRAIPGELVPHYQPVVSLDDGRIVGAEALVRWCRDGELVPPGEFIPLAEQSGLVVALGGWMLEEACHEAARWDGGRVSVNVSGRQVAQGSLVATVARALEASGLEPHRLQLELTESVLMEDVERHVALLHELKGLGVGLALDDFGKGYSSLSYLHRFPFDRIKIDRAFVGRLPGDPVGLAIVSAVLSFGRALDMDVVAEGIENPEQLEVLRELGCEYAQGFFFHRPMGAAQLREILA